jgi:hypothetical protein
LIRSAHTDTPNDTNTKTVDEVQESVTAEEIKMYGSKIDRQEPRIAKQRRLEPDMPQLILVAEQVDRSKVHTGHPKHDGGGDHIAILNNVYIGRARARSWKKSRFTLEYVTVVEHPIGAKEVFTGSVRTQNVQTQRPG